MQYSFNTSCGAQANNSFDVLLCVMQSQMQLSLQQYEGGANLPRNLPSSVKK